MERLSVDFPKKSKLTFSIYPAPQVEAWQWYMSLHQVQQLETFVISYITTQTAERAITWYWWKWKIVAFQYGIFR
jgi:hypothetical protein